PPELGVGQYNVSNLGVQPSYGLWARHVKNLEIKNSSFDFESNDDRYVLFLDDVEGAIINTVTMRKGKHNDEFIATKNSGKIKIDNATAFNREPRDVVKLNLREKQKCQSETVYLAE